MAEGEAKLVPPQDRIKTPYVLCLNRCSFRVTLFTALPPSLQLHEPQSLRSWQTLFRSVSPARLAILPCWCRQTLSIGFCTRGWIGQRIKSKNSPAVFLHTSAVIPLQSLLLFNCLYSGSRERGGKWNLKITFNTTFHLFRLWMSG